MRHKPVKPVAEISDQPSTSQRNTSDDNTLDARIQRAVKLVEAEKVLKDPELYVTLDEPNPSKQQYSVQQITDLWNWYKEEMDKNVDEFAEDLKKPLEPKQRTELEALARRLGWFTGGPPTGREDLHPFAYKYKKLKDYETLTKAAKFKTPEQRKAELEELGAPLDVIPAEDILNTPADVAAQNELQYRQQLQEEEDEVRRQQEALQRPSYSEDSEWWSGWENPEYKDLPTQPFLQMVIDNLLLKKQQDQQEAAKKLAADKAAAAAAAASPSTSAAPQSPPPKGRAAKKAARAAAAAAAAAKEAEIPPDSLALWRALPIQLDPFVMRSPAEEGFQLVSGANLQELPAAAAGKAGQRDSGVRLTDSQRAFLLSAAAVLGFSAYRWIRRRLRRRAAQA